jgi:tetratricopeptide (TPR) repeat protein
MSTRSGLALGLLLATSWMTVRAQHPLLVDPPSPLTPLRPQTKQELAHREALELYGLGMFRQHQDRLVDAMHLFEEARTLDPAMPSVYKALIPLYLALGRNDDVLTACRKIVDLDPGDYETWAVYARQLKNLARPKEARQALLRGLACKGLAEHAELRLHLQYDLGVLCEDAKDYDAAVNAFQEVVKVLDHPQGSLDLGTYNQAELADQAANTYERMIKICIQAKQYDRALKLFAQGQKLHPGLARRLNYNLAKVHLAQQHPDQALTLLDEYLKTQPYGTEAYELRSTILQQLGRPQDILPGLKEFAQRDSFNVALHLLLARQYVQDGQPDAAEAEYKKLAETSPTPEVYRALFALYQSQDVEKVLQAFNQAVSASFKKDGGIADPQSAAKARAMLLTLRESGPLVKALVPKAEQFVRRGGGDLHSETQFYLAVLAARDHQLEAAAFFYRRCLQLLPDSQLVEADVYQGLLQVLREAHDYEAIAETCRQALKGKQQTTPYVFHLNLALAQARLHKGDEALAEANKAVEVAGAPQRLGALLNRVHILTETERFPQARSEIEALSREFTQPGEVRAVRMSLYGVYTAMHDYPKAEEQLQLVLKADPDDVTANNDLGYLWADQNKNLVEAERMIRKALDLDAQQRKGLVGSSAEADEETAAYVDSMGWVLFRRGQVQDARGWLEKAAALYGGQGDPVVWDHLGDVYARLKENAKAKAAWKKSLTFYETEKWRKPDEHYKEVKHKLQLLDSQTQP